MGVVHLLTLLFFALALNMDAFAAGAAYGMRKINLPLYSVLVISGMSVLAIVFSMLAGGFLAGIIQETFARRLGGLILLLAGLRFIWQSLGKNRKLLQDQEKSKPKTLLAIRLRSLGLIIQVSREPQRADLDHSGEISLREAFLLGTALAMDSLGAGFAARLLGFELLPTAAFVGMGQVALTYLGLLAGKGAGATWFGRQLSVFPGFILILLGLSKLH
jgi:putative sporulation protein YtaF